MYTEAETRIHPKSAILRLTPAVHRDVLAASRARAHARSRSDEV
jgi:hypothetical protein